jgi:hypothetical protein
LRPDSLNRESFWKVVELLHSAGLVILVAAGIPDAELMREVEEKHKDKALFDLSDELEQLSSDGLISKILGQARSLRLRPATEKGE